MLAVIIDPYVSTQTASIGMYIVDVIIPTNLVCVLFGTLSCTTVVIGQTLLETEK